LAAAWSNRRQPAWRPFRLSDRWYSGEVKNPLTFSDEGNWKLTTAADAMELVGARMRAGRGAFNIHDWASQIPLPASPAIQGVSGGSLFSR